MEINPTANDFDQQPRDIGTSPKLVWGRAISARCCLRLRAGRALRVTIEAVVLSLCEIRDLTAASDIGPAVRGSRRATVVRRVSVRQTRSGGFPRNAVERLGRAAQVCRASV